MTSARQDAVQFARRVLANQPLYLDTETTGIDRFSEIVEICLISDQNQVIFESLVKPTRRIPADATRIHGITQEMVHDAPTWLHVWPEVELLLASRQIGIYNADFDLRLLQQTHARYGLAWSPPAGTSFFCIMRLYAQYYGEWDRYKGSYRWQSLEAAGRQSKIPLPNTHRAKDDTLLARAIRIILLLVDKINRDSNESSDQDLI